MRPNIDLRGIQQSCGICFALMLALLLTLCKPSLIWPYITKLGHSVQIIYLQETIKTYNSGNFDSLNLIAVSGWSSSTQYTMSTWVKMPALQPNWTVIFRLSENPR